MATLKPTTPLHTPSKGPMKPASPLRGQTAPKTPISHPQRRWRFQPDAHTSEQRRQGFQTTGPARLQHPHAVPVGGGGTWPDNKSTRRDANQPPGAAGVEGAGETGGPGRGAGGRRQGQGGPRDRPLRAKLACGDLAGGPPPTGTHRGPAQKHTRRPKHQRRHKQHQRCHTQHPHANGWGASRHPTRHQHQSTNRSQPALTPSPAPPRG